MKMNQTAMILSAIENRLQSRLSLTHHVPAKQIQPLSKIH